MDFSGVTNDTSAKVFEVIEYILGLNISPDEKATRIAIVIRSVGDHFHSQLYGAAGEVFDSNGMTSRGIEDADGQAKRLGIKIVRNYALTREIAPLVSSYFNTVLGSAEQEAFSNAVSMQKHPTLTRRANRGKPDCDYCKEKEGVYTDPKSDDFKRHKKCDCELIVGGYNTRNGLLTNYTKGKAK